MTKFKVVEAGVANFTLVIDDISDAEFASMKAAIAFYKKKAKAEADEGMEGYGLVAKHDDGLALVSNGEESNFLLVPEGNEWFKEIEAEETEESVKKFEEMWFDMSKWKAVK